MIITVPYGKSKRKDLRVYNDRSLRELLSGLKIETVEFFALRNGYWGPISQSEAEEIETPDFTTQQCVSLLKLSKK